jgi:MOSC domain-containing protein YiiM
MAELKQLLNTLPQKGRVEKITLRPARQVWPETRAMAELSCAAGLVGDHYSGKNGKRQVTLIQQEHLEVVAKLLGREELLVELTRRNVVVSGINLLAFSGKQFRIGEVVLEMTGHCHPCSRMEELLGPGGYNAMRGHGGITARVIKEGIIREGDAVVLVEGEGN